MLYNTINIDLTKRLENKIWQQELAKKPGVSFATGYFLKLDGKNVGKAVKVR